MNKREKTSERRIRYALRKEGSILRKRRRQLSSDNQGGYMLIDAEHDYIDAGGRSDMTLDDLKGRGPTFQKPSI